MNWKTGDVARYRADSEFDAIVRIMHVYDNKVNAVVVENIAGKHKEHLGWEVGYILRERYAISLTPISNFKQQLKELL